MEAFNDYKKAAKILRKRVFDRFSTTSTNTYRYIHIWANIYMYSLKIEVSGKLRRISLEIIKIDKSTARPTGVEMKGEYTAELENEMLMLILNCT